MADVTEYSRQADDLVVRLNSRAGTKDCEHIVAVFLIGSDLVGPSGPEVSR